MRLSPRPNLEHDVFESNEETCWELSLTTLVHRDNDFELEEMNHDALLLGCSQQSQIIQNQYFIHFQNATSESFLARWFCDQSCLGKHLTKRILGFLARQNETSTKNCL